METEDSVSEVKSYNIGGRVFEQRELVLAQWRQLTALLEGVEIPAEGDMVRALVAGLETHGRLDAALAVVLTERGSSPRDKDRAALARELEAQITPQHVAEVIQDFFTCNPVSSVLDRLSGMLGLLLIGLARAMVETGSKSFVSCSPAEIGAAATPSSGPAPPAPPSHGCVTEAAK